MIKLYDRHIKNEDNQIIKHHITDISGKVLCSFRYSPQTISFLASFFGKNNDWVVKNIKLVSKRKYG